MIIPVKCVTCGKVIADKYRHFKVLTAKTKLSKNSTATEDIIYLTTNTNAKTDKTSEGLALDLLRLTDMCCRRHMLTHVDIE
jgi:DNA-directed RNA polymerase I, II, and III subunit RPABC5